MNWRRILLLSIALVSVLGITTWALLQNSDVATEFVRRQLKQAFTTPTEIANTSINLEAGRLQISGLQITDPSNPTRKLARVATANIDVQSDLFGDGVQLRHVSIEGLDVECGPTWPTLTELLQPIDSATTTESVRDFPVIHVRSGTAIVHLCEDEQPLTCDELQVTVAPLASDPSKLQIRGELSLTKPAARLDVKGEVDLESGAAQLTVTTKAVRCSNQVVAYLARLARVENLEVDIGGEIESLSLTFTVPPKSAANQTPTLQLLAKCTDLHVDKENLPAIVRHANLTLFADTSGKGSMRATIEQNNETGQLSITTNLTGFNERSEDDGASAMNFDLRADGRNVVVDGDSLAALRSFPIGKELVEALRPTAGRGDIALYLENPTSPDGIAEMDLTMRDAKMTFRGFGDQANRIGFPLELEQASGRVQLRGHWLLLEDMKASIPQAAGGGEVTLMGRIDLDQPSGEDTSLDIHGESVAFSPSLATALATLLGDEGDLYKKLAPSGRAEVHVVVRPRSKLPGGFFVEIKPREAAMRWQGFPYSLGSLRGSIRVRHTDARFDLTGRHADGGLTMRGRIPLRDEHTIDECFEAVITADQLVLDEDLLAGVAMVVPELEVPWRKTAPTGRISGEIKAWRPQSNSELFHDIRLSLHDVDLQLPAAPWRATGLAGQVLVQGSGAEARIDFDALRGQLENENAKPAQLALLGHIESGKKVVRDLAFVVRDLELCEQLGRSLDELGALDFATWSSLKPSGRIDLVVRDRSGISAKDNLAVVVQLVDVRSEAPMLPKPAEHMTGELHIENGELTFRDVRGQLANATVHCANGRVRQLPKEDGRTEISFEVHAKDFPVDDGLANLFSGPLQKAVRERQLRGQADVDGLRLRFAIPTGDSKKPFETTLSGSIGLDGVDVLLGTSRDGIRVVNLHGLVTLSESSVTDQGGQLIGTLGRGSLSLFGHSFEAVEAAFTADAERLTLRTLKTRIHDGELGNADPNLAALTYLLPAPNVPQGRLAADLAYEGIDVFALLSQTGWENPPYSGSASGRATLRRLDGNNVVGAEAKGTLKIERADLGKVPLFKAIYAQLPAADQPRFNQLDMTYRLTDQAIVFDQLEIRSDILAAKGAGQLNLDGYLDVKMELDNLLGQSADPLVMPLIEYLAQNLVSFRLYGHLRDLRASTQLVGGSTPERPPVLPMPPARKKTNTPGY
tara:strand:+ start:324688 stop:328290 length:3603 start_codon:yes stop_codon:yes gene_type:complete